jgi:endonuclease YncB( thermonuclease family)
VAKKAMSLLLLGAVGYLAAAGVPERGSSSPSAPDAAAWFVQRGKVTRVVDGDTVRVQVGKKVEKVRLIGIDAAEVGACYSSQATAELRRLALNKRVVLRGDRTQARRDQYGRLLAYVDLATGPDVSLHLIRRGFAPVYVYNSRPFARFNQYDAAERQASSSRLGTWSACSSTSTSTATTTTSTVTTALPVVPPPPAANCTPSYPDVCIPPPPPDLDCGEIPYKRFRVIYTVPNPDPHRFDGNKDGIGCET